MALYLYRLTLVPVQRDPDLRWRSLPLPTGLADNSHGYLEMAVSEYGLVAWGYEDSTNRNQALLCYRPDGSLRLESGGKSWCDWVRSLLSPKAVRVLTELLTDESAAAED